MDIPTHPTFINFKRNSDWTPAATRNIANPIEALKRSFRIQLKTFPAKKRQSKDLNSAQEFLKSHPELILTLADKNLGFALLPLEKYHELAMEHLSSNTYVFMGSNSDKDFNHRFVNWQVTTRLLLCKSHFLDRLHWSAKKLLTTMPKLEYSATTDTYTRWPVPAFHILPKLHKRQLSGRPIAGAVNWMTTDASKMLDKLLRFHLVRNCEHILKDSFTLAQKLTETPYHVPEGAILVSFDIVSLYPSIDLKRLYALMERFTGGPSSACSVLTRFICNNSFVEYADKIFRQITGIAMGTNAAVSLANFYLLKCFDHAFRDLNIQNYFRYIDDLFLVWTGTRAQLNDFHTHINRLVPGITTTMSTSTTHMDFLDMTLFVQDGILCTKVFQKSIHRFQYIPYMSDHPRHHLTSFIKGELTRYARLCSLKIHFEDLKRLFFDRLLRRGYPRKLLKRIFDSFNYDRKFPQPKEPMWSNISRLVIPYNHRFPKSRFYEWLKFFQPFFPNPLQLVFKGNPNLRTTLTKSRLSASQIGILPHF